ncbi:hypothetical protein PNH38_16960 [Anoxybacillus rupiensis]|jgi:hypothetical protein|uniref:Uncharacterized protein n=1 Tax=Anoxybacteroides rupiense TaxID=311460 RepID=A0ABT5W888_9BACL|nr:MULTISPECIES: hypothetical protein [Anoxybacillus]MBS2771890.1 hypothetical protein [Anoxybacillus rupiensis]MDE8565537.1 hypothetical protein [Anoxybacillus rupiensis]QHC02808.1 hypothetical protein GRQ40_01520 [Anoxybacillus sp. PDR2]
MELIHICVVEELYKQTDSKHPRTVELNKKTCIYPNKSTKQQIMDGYTGNDALRIKVR